MSQEDVPGARDTQLEFELGLMLVEDQVVRSKLSIEREGGDIGVVEVLRYKGPIFRSATVLEREPA